MRSNFKVCYLNELVSADLVVSLAINLNDLCILQNFNQLIALNPFNVQTFSDQFTVLVVNKGIVS